MGVTFKENCPDIRNSKVFDLINFLEDKKYKIDVYDPYADPIEVKYNYNIKLLKNIKFKKYDAIFVSLAHDCFLAMGLSNIKSYLKTGGYIFDLKNNFNLKSRFHKNLKLLK